MLRFESSTVEKFSENNIFKLIIIRIKLNFINSEENNLIPLEKNLSSI
jgi:hypothetical protein